MTSSSGWAGISFTCTAASTAAVILSDSGDLPGVEKPSCSGRSTLPAFTSRDWLRWRPRRHLQVLLERPTRIHERLVKIFPCEGFDSVCKFGAELAGGQLGVRGHSSSSAVASGCISLGDDDDNGDDEDTSTISNTGTQNRGQLSEQWMKLYEENGFLFTDESWGALQQKEEEGEEEKVHGSVPDWVQENWSLAITAGRAQNASKVLVWGGSLAFVQHLWQVVSPSAIVVVHLSLSVLGAIKERDDAVQCWCGDVLDLSSSYGPFNTVFLNSLVATAESLDLLLGGVATLCSTGARIVICHAGRQEDLQAGRVNNHHLAVRSLPGGAQLESLLNSLPLNLIDLQDRPAIYLAILEVAETDGKSHSPNGSGKVSETRSLSLQTPLDLQKLPLRAKGHVVQGFGRGSKQLGIPTANIDPGDLSREVIELPKGVYFGWATQPRADGIDCGVHKMVMNIGNRPTFSDGENVTVEVHILHSFDTDFYGKQVNIIVLGFIRYEMRFGSIGDLLARIKEDITTAETRLDEDEMASFATDAFLHQK